MSQWENLPEPAPQRPAVPVTLGWGGFSADPRQPANRELRASDADRDFATRLVDQAWSEGRLDAAEHAARSLAVRGSRMLGEFVPLVSDVMVAAAARGAGERARNRFARAGLTGWVGLALLFNAIWLMTCLTAGRLLYYWPMWPMLGTAVPMLMALLWGGPSGRAAQPPADRPALPPGENDLR